MAVRAGWILKAGGFDCGSNQLSAALSRLLFALFLPKQEKGIICAAKDDRDAVFLLLSTLLGFGGVNDPALQ